MVDTVHVNESVETGRIAPAVYGHFAEHLGRCIYGGLWVGEDDPLDTEGGVRADTLDLLAALDPPLLRWPGGCFADDYHWEDGVGEDRPRRRNLWWTQGRENVPEEPNEFGTHEFLAVCERIGADPYLAANLGSGSPEEAVDWVEYCNYDGDTDLARRRAENGREEPFGVPYWGVGNENWGCGGDYDPDAYGREFRRYANYLSGYDRLMGDGGLELVAVGHTTRDWNRRFLQAVGEDAHHLVDHLSVHRYYHAGDAVDFDEEEYYRLFARSLAVADDVDRAARALEEFAPGADAGVALDEWGVWHPRAESDNGLEQPNTVRDAVSAAGVLDLLNARADVVSMANLAQTVNVLQCVVQTDEEAAWPTPTYRVFDLYRPHMGATALHTAVDTYCRDVVDAPRDVPFVSASASRDGDEAYVTLSNRDLVSRDVLVDVSAASVEATALFGGHDPSAHSTRENADEFAGDDLDADVSGEGVALEAPACSVVGLSVDLDD